MNFNQRACIAGGSITLAALVLLVSCGRAEPPQAVPQAPVAVQPQTVPAPAQVVVVQQPAQQSMGGDGFLTGMLMGHLMSGGGGGYGAAAVTHNTTVNKTVINKTYVAPPRPAAIQPRATPSFRSAPSFRAGRR